LGKKLFSIGEISRIKGITKKALRFYDGIGLLSPSFTNPDNGYRFYAMEQFIQIDIIKALRGMDVSPLDIRTIVTRKDTGELMRFLDAQRLIAGGKIEELRRVVETIDGVQGTIRDSLSSCSHKGLYRKRIEARHIVTLPYGDWSSDAEAAMEFSKFDGIIEERGLANAYQTGILYETRGSESLPSRLFNTVRLKEGSDPSKAQTLPAGDYLCVCFSKDDAAEQVLKINRYCAGKGMMPTLVLQVELLNDVFSPDSAGAELELLVKELPSAAAAKDQPRIARGRRGRPAAVSGPPA
jgi:MerR family transcriptional activator of bmr gene